MPKVIIIQRVLTKYREPFYKRLKEECVRFGIDLELIHGIGNESDRKRGYLGHCEWARVVEEKYIKIGKTSLVVQPYLRYLKGADLVVVQQEMRWLINLALLMKRKESNFKLAFWGHGINRQQSPHGLLNKLKKRFMNKVDGWFAYTQGVADEIINNGFTKDKVAVVYNTIDTQGIRETIRNVSSQELDDVRRELGLKEGPVGIFCGGMYPHKRISFLVEACFEIRKKIPTFQMLFVGDGIDRKIVENAKKNNNWIFALGSQFGRKKMHYFLSSDIILMPGLVGLVVCDSFAFEKPLVTTHYPFHSPEIEYLENGKNGYMTNDTIGDYAGTVIRLLESSSDMEALRIHCRRSAEKYTIANMVRHFIKGIDNCLKN